MWYVYILLCKDGSLYTGSTNDVPRRFQQHLDGKGAKYTRSHKPVRILHTEAFSTKSAALQKEHHIKTWPKHKKVEYCHMSNSLRELALSLHHQAEEAREHKDYQHAENLYNEAFQKYTEANWKAGAAEMLVARSILYRRLAAEASSPADQKKWQGKGKADIDEGLKLALAAQVEGDASALALVYFNVAKYYEAEDKLQEAIAHFKLAIEWFTKSPPERHNRPAVLWDFKLKLALAEFFAGKVAALAEAEHAIAELQQDTGIDADYNIKVWVSGAYLRLAEWFREKDEVTRAKEYLTLASQIILSDERLIIRKNDLEKLKKVIH